MWNKSSSNLVFNWHDGWEPAASYFSSSFSLTPPLTRLFFPSHSHLHRIEQTRASLPLSSWLIEDVRVTARTCHSSKQCIKDGVPVCVVYACSSKYANLRWHIAWFSLLCPCVCWCELPGTCALGGMVGCVYVCVRVCVWVNVGCHYLFLGIGSLSCLRTDVEECLGHLAIQLQQLSSTCA